MTTAVRPPPAASKPADNGRIELMDPVKAAKPTPTIIVTAIEGFGKTSLPSFGPSPAILMARGETGYRTLFNAGRVPKLPCAELGTWKETLDLLDRLAVKFDGGLLALDALGGFERLCHEFVCARDFGGDWGEKGFSGFQRGPDVSVTEWLGLLTRLEKIRVSHGIPIVLLSHSAVKPFKNPLGPDFDRYVADCHAKTWSVTHKWADEVYFGNFVTVTVEDRQTKRKKGIGGRERVVYTRRCDAYDAKSRYGVPEQITMPEDPAEMWKTIFQHIEGSALPPVPAF